MSKIGDSDRKCDINYEPKTHFMQLLIKSILIAFLIGTLQQMPYGYYQLTKWILFVGCMVLGYQVFKNKNYLMLPIYGIIALTFMPFIDYGFKRAEWQLIDKITIGVVFFSACSELVVTWLKNRRQA